MRSWLIRYRYAIIFWMCFGVFRTSLADWNPIPSGSMRPTLLEGDVVLVNRVAYDLKVPLTDISLARLDNPQRGDVVTFSSPKDGMRLIKRIVGIPGDLIEHRGDQVCIAAECFPLAMKNGQPFAPPLAEGVIPDGFYAAFGTSADSLDSRYATIGLFSEERIHATGFGTNLFPHWTELKQWADARGQ